MLSLGLISALVSLIFISFSDALLKKVSVAFGGYISSLAIGLSIPTLFLVFILIPSTITSIILLLCLVAGIAVAAGYVFILISLETEQASNTWALVNIAYVPIVLMGIFVLQQSVNLIQLMSIVLIFVGSALVTITKDIKFNKSLVPAIFGNLLFGIFNVVTIYEISQYTYAASAVYFITWSIAFVALIVYGWVTSRLKLGSRILKINKNKKTAILFALAGGLVIGISQTAWIFAILYKFVTIGGALLATEPILVVIICYFMYKEKLTLLQGVGIIVSVLGTIILSLL
ncbi:MAG: DMT family transporter [Candidatus Micrarchaeales archaeon]|jgi:drug/metabolite transporter (DMT)-like permease